MTANPKNITDKQMALLCDLYALENAGLIYAGGDEPVNEGYDEGSFRAEVPPTLTFDGRRVVEQFTESGRTITP